MGIFVIIEDFFRMQLEKLYLFIIFLALFFANVSKLRLFSKHASTMFVNAQICYIAALSLKASPVLAS